MRQSGDRLKAAIALRAAFQSTAALSDIEKETSHIPSQAVVRYHQDEPIAPLL
jgi:hypothetical protein